MQWALYSFYIILFSHNTSFEDKTTRICLLTGFEVMESLAQLSSALFAFAHKIPDHYACLYNRKIRVMRESTFTVVAQQ